MAQRRKVEASFCSLVGAVGVVAVVVVVLEVVVSVRVVVVRVVAVGVVVVGVEVVVSSIMVAGVEDSSTRIEMEPSMSRNRMSSTSVASKLWRR